VGKRESTRERERESESEYGGVRGWRGGERQSGASVIMTYIGFKKMKPKGVHRDGGPFGISLESLAAQGVSLETGALWDVIPKS